MSDQDKVLKEFRVLLNGKEHGTIIIKAYSDEDLHVMTLRAIKALALHYGVSTARIRLVDCAVNEENAAPITAPRLL